MGLPLYPPPSSSVLMCQFHFFSTFLSSVNYHFSSFHSPFPLCYTLSTFNQMTLLPNEPSSNARDSEFIPTIPEIVDERGPDLWVRRSPCFEVGLLLFSV